MNQTCGWNKQTNKQTKKNKKKQQNKTKQNKTIQYNTIQYNTIQYNTKMAITVKEKDDSVYKYIKHAFNSFCLLLEF